jgi:hypothetical protein
MSQASRERARLKALALLETTYGPFPAEPVEPEPELARLLAWFFKERKNIAEEMNVQEIFVTDEDGGKVLVCQKPKREKSVTSSSCMALLAALSLG